MISLHSQGNTTTGIKPASSVIQYYINCNVCGVQVAKKRLAKHLLKAHQVQIAKELPEKYPAGKNAKTEVEKVRNSTNSRHSKNNHGYLIKPPPVSPDYPGTVGSLAMVKGVKPSSVHNDSKTEQPRMASFISTTNSSRKTIRKKITHNNRAHLTEEIYSNMVGDWKDVDTSKHHGVSLKGGSASTKPLARQMADDLNARSVQCPICKKMIDRAAYNAHVSIAHKTKKSKRRGKGKQVDSHPAKHQHNIPPREFLRDKEMDGSKHLGQHRRESSGQFGSYPLHDDYSDESDAG